MERISMKKEKILFLIMRATLYIAFAVALLYFLYVSPYNPHPQSADDIRRWVIGFGIWAPLIYVAVYTVRPLLFFPTLLLNLSAGVLFGVVGNILPAFGRAWMCEPLLSAGTFRRRVLVAEKFRRQLGWKADGLPCRRGWFS